MRRLNRREVVVNLKSGTVMRGVWWKHGWGVAVLKNTQMLADRGQTLKPAQSVDGEAIVKLADVDWIQNAGGQ